MQPRTRYTFFINAELRDAIAGVKDRDGISESEQIRRALKMWLKREKGIDVAADRPVKAQGRLRNARKRGGR